MSNLYPRLTDSKTSALKFMLDYLDMSKWGNPNIDRVRIAMMLMIDDELRFRDPRRKPRVPRPPTPKRSEDRNG